MPKQIPDHKTEGGISFFIPILSTCVVSTVMEKEIQCQLLLVSQRKELFESYVDLAKQRIFTGIDHLRISN